MKSFDIPAFYRSGLIGAIKEKRRLADKLKKDFSPSILDFGGVEFQIARHFGFCYGVENAVEIAYRTLEEHPDKRPFLLSEMIHNPDVNKDLVAKGMRFIFETDGSQIIPWSEINSEDIVLVPAFGTTIETYQKLAEIGVEVEKYDTTCPFVEKVWNRSEQIAKRNYTVVIHGKPEHEETKATFSHAAKHGPAVIVKNMADAEQLVTFIENPDKPGFSARFSGQLSAGFDPEAHLQKIGVVNQTTMLASDTQAIADFLKASIQEKYQDQSEGRFANTRDTLCYATNDNQEAVLAMLPLEADLAIVVGGRKSSNSSHLVELFETHKKTIFIENEGHIDKLRFEHFDIHRGVVEMVDLSDMAANKALKIQFTCGASCPDAIFERVILKVAEGLKLDVDLMQFS